MKPMNEHRYSRVADVILKSDYDADNGEVGFLADIMHYCDAMGRDFDASLSTARMHHKAETTGGE